MLSLKTKFFFGESTISWREMQITEELDLNETSQENR